MAKARGGENGRKNYDGRGPDWNRAPPIHRTLCERKTIQGSHGRWRASRINGEKDNRGGIEGC